MGVVVATVSLNCCRWGEPWGWWWPQRPRSVVGGVSRGGGGGHSVLELL